MTWAKQTSRSKYGARRTMVENVAFASKREAARYQELRLLERAGEITGLELQPAFELHAPNGGKVGEWRGDFQYTVAATGEVILEDVKSKPTRTRLYLWKVKHFRLEYGRTVSEVF